VAAVSSVASFPVNKADVVMEAVMLTRTEKDRIDDNRDDYEKEDTVEVES